MALQIETSRPPLRTDSSGVVRVGNTRVALDTVVEQFEQGATAEEIAHRFDALTLADIYATIGFYLQNRPEVEQYLLHRRNEASRARQEIDRRVDMQDVRQRLLARRQAKA
ncbi:MAG: DUF433 domain-containing protein [Tepidisphaeraceae bacterium]